MSGANETNYQKLPSKAARGGPERIVVGLSGGMQSAVAAALLKAQGLLVHGIHLSLDPGSMGAFPSRCRRQAESALAAAREIARVLDIPLEILSVEERFRAQVEDPFVHDRLNQKFATSCGNCHVRVKIGTLLEAASERGIERVATGHGAVILFDASARQYRLQRATEREQDQAGLLVGLTQEQLARLFFPLGDLSKIIVQRLSAEISERLGSELATDVERTLPCLGQEADVEALFKKRLPSYFHNPGAIRTSSGSMVGEHRGLWQYFAGKPLTVDKQKFAHEKSELIVAYLDTAQGSFVVAPRTDWPAKRWLLGEFQQTRPLNLLLPLAVQVEIPRSRQFWPERPLELEALLLPLEGGRVMLDLGEEKVPLMAGETLVFCQGPEVLGSARVLAYLDFGGQIKAGGRSGGSNWEGESP